MLRRAIWNWIENYTEEYIALCHRQNRIDGSPEILFDIFNSLADTTKRKAIFWPVQTMLIVLCPDIMVSTSGCSPPVQNKKVIQCNSNILLPLANRFLSQDCIFQFLTESNDG